MKPVDFSGDTKKPAPRRATSRRKPSGRTVLVAVGIVLSGCLLLALVTATALLQPPASISLIGVGAHYATNLYTPHNAHGWNGLYAASSLGGENHALQLRGRPLLKNRPPIGVDKYFEWPQAVQQMSGRTAVLLVSMHGGGDAEGPYLLRSDFDPAAPRRLRVDQLLHVLRSQPADQKKLVVFDATTSPGMWRYGELQNRFATTLRGLNEAIAKDPNLVVISASDQGERSWPESTASSTIFLHTLVEGLRGAARDSDQDGRISGQEFVAYLRSTVAARVSVLHGRSQSVLVLPLGAPGEERLQKMDLVLANPRFTPTNTMQPAAPKEELAGRWQESEVLAARLKLPACSATLTWRRRQRMLIRYEQLLAAGAPNLAAEVAPLLDKLQQKLQLAADELEEQADPVQLAAPDQDQALDEQAGKLLAELWASPPAGVQLAWEKGRAATPASQQSTLSRRLHDLVLDRVVEAPVENLKHGAEVLKAIGETGRARPAESHLVVMLPEGLPADLSNHAWDNALKLAIQTRRKAEAVTGRGDAYDQSFAPLLLPWVSQGMSRADRLRREGEDLLFCGAEYLPRAVEALQQAADEYQQLSDRAAAVTQAISARDEAFQLLPYYTDSLANVYSSPGESHDEVNHLVDLLEQAWQAAHTLGEALLSSNKQSAPNDSAVNDVQQFTTALNDTLAVLQTAMQSWRTSLLTRSGAAFWNNRDAALLAPDLHLGQRLRLLAAQPQATNGVLLDQRAMRLSESKQAEWRSQEAVRRGRLALAAFGRRLFEEGLHRRDSYTSAAASLSSADDAPGGDPEVDLARLETDLIRARQTWRTVIKQESRLSADRKLTPDTRRRLAMAAAVVRRLDDGEGDQSTDNPLDLFQRVRRFNYMLWRARRVVADGWNSEPSSAQPYSQLAAEAYLKGAERSLPARHETDGMIAQAKRDQSVTVTALDEVDVVSGVAPPVNYRVAGGATKGIAAVSFKAGAGLSVLSPPAGSRHSFQTHTGPSNTRRSVGVGVVVGGEADSHPLQNLSDPASAATLTINAWLRGHTAAKQTAVVVHHAPDSDFLSPPAPRQAGLAVVAPREFSSRLGGGSGGVAFVLDASGSMGPTGDPSSSKYAEAVEALRSLLTDTPAGVRVSVWVFGQAVGAQKTVENAEATIEQVLRPVTWDPTDAELLQRVTSALVYPRVEPWNKSPLVRTILAAARDLRGVSGYKSVVAITDGVDNRFSQDGWANPRGEAVGDVLARELAGAGVSVQLIAFRVADEEQQAARRQFAFLGSLSPPGKWWEADQRDALEQTLRRALSHRNELPLQPLGQDAHAGVAFVSPSSQTPAWQTTPLTPGAYGVSLADQTSGGDALQRVSLDRGDLLLLSMRETVRGVALSRSMFTPAHLPAKPAQESGDWRATVIHHRRLPNRATSLLLTVEGKPAGDDGPDAVIRLPRPTGLWIESTPGETQRSRTSWISTYGYPAPCWEVERRPLTDGGEVGRRMTVWWSGPQQCEPAISLRRGEDYRRLKDLVGRSWDVAGTPVELVRIACESCRLPNGKGQQVEQDCLVVELATSTPCTVRLNGLTPEGQRQSVFNRARRCVARFWPLNEKRVDEGLQGLEVVSISEFKRHAESMQQVARFNELPEPSAGEPRPLPSVGWLGASLD